MHLKRALVPEGVFMVVMAPPDAFWMNGFPNVIQLVEVRPQDSGADMIQHMKETHARAVAHGIPTVPCDGRDVRIKAGGGKA